MFQHFKKLWSGEAEDAAGSPTSKPSPPPVDPEQLAALQTTADETDELDAIYRQALDALDVVEVGVRTATDDLPDEDGEDSDTDDDVVDAFPSIATRHRNGEPATHLSVSPNQILEAALFVGGIDLTLKRLCQLLRDEFPPETVEAFLDEMNGRYADEGRPYEIRFGEGGYRLALRAEFDDVRNRVFGLGPREFKLTQAALEILSLIAYEQPVEADRILQLRGDNPAGLLRQLLRRELISLERNAGESKSVIYRTTPRFLQAFGLATLDDLPLADDLAFK